MKIGYIAEQAGAATMDGNAKIGTNWSAIPNALTIARGLAAPVVVWLLVNHHHQAAFWLFLLAAFSDVIDGYVAKQLNCASALGAWIDPLADKALVAFTFVALGWIDVIPAWLIVLAIARDLGILAGVGLLQALRRPFDMRPTLISKFNTFVQLLLVGFGLGQFGLRLEDDAVIDTVIVLLVYLATFTAVASWLVYGGQLARALRGGPR